MKKKNGFTLIELLAVIVILAIIALIAVPIVLNLIERSRKGATLRSAEGIVKASNMYYVDAQLSESGSENISFSCTKNGCISDVIDENGENKKLDIDGNVGVGNVAIDISGNVSFNLEINGYCTSKSANNNTINIKKGKCEIETPSLICEDDPNIEESPKEWFTFDEETGTLIGYSEIWMTLEDENKYDIVIPSKTPEGNPVVKIGEDAFNSEEYFGSEGEYRGEVKSVVIPCSVQIIGDEAFYGKEGEYTLDYVTIPNSVTEIGSYAFADNNIASLDLGEVVQTIGEGAFSNNQLTSVTIPDNVTYLSGFNDNNLTEINIPESVTEIGDYAFAGNNFTSVKIPDSVITIMSDAFLDNKLESVTIPNSVTTIQADAFNNNNLTSLDLGESVQTIEEAAFFRNKLEYVKIPNSVITIGDGAFGANNLTHVDLGTGVQTIESDAFAKGKVWGGSNLDLVSIINRTGKEFNWSNILDISGTYTFETGIVESDYGNVTITNGNE